MKFAVLNVTTGIVVDTFDDPDDCLKEVEQQNLQDPEQIYTMVSI
jgi:hypothetical protein